jgi:hypothetical protein|tara:strand:+ start:114 stop:659 length:546 start_codon:yes stop_codon:yes gene_type:complete
MTASYRDGILISAEQKISRLQSLIQQRRDILDALNRNASDISKIEVSRNARVHPRRDHSRDQMDIVPASRTSSDKPHQALKKRKKIQSDIPLRMRISKILVDNNNISMLNSEILVACFADGWRTSSDKPQSVIGQALSQGNEFKKHGSKRQRNAKWSIKENVLGNKIVWRDSLTSKGSETN